MSSSTTLRLSLAGYNRMVSDGAFDSLGKRRIELVNGEIRERSRPEPSQADVVSRLTRWSCTNTNETVVCIRVRNPIEIPIYDSAPEPDVVWIKAKDYSKQHPQTRDVLLVIEVADSSLDEDLGEMAVLYARAGIKDFLGVNIPDMCVAVFRQPRRLRYTKRRTYQVGETVSPLALPKAKLSVGGLFSGTL